MKLVIGGRAQGKLDWVLQKEEKDHFLILDGRLPVREDEKEADSQKKIICVNHFHLWVREMLLQGEAPEGELEVFMEKHPAAIVISDEIGNGIVPAERFEREYRERTGRLLEKIAGQSDEVVRVICGIGQKIK